MTSRDDPVPPPEEAPPASDAPPPEGARSREALRTRLIVGASTVLTVAVLAAVVVLAQQAREERERQEVGALPPWAASPPPGRGAVRQTGWPDPDCAPDPERPPRLVLELPSEGVDFGLVEQGVVIDREVVFRNEGRGPLCIREVQTGCGCVKAEVVEGAERLEPGSSGRVVVHLDSTGRSGLQKKSVRLYTNDFTHPVHTFDVRADISAGLLVHPAMVTFGRTTRGSEARAVLTMRSATGDEDWRVLSVTGRRPVDGDPIEYAFEVREQTRDARYVTRELVITHPGLDREGPFQDAIEIRTDHPQRPEILVQAHLMVVPPLLVVPPRVVLGYVSPGETPSVSVRVAPGKEGETFRVEDAYMIDGRGERSSETGFVATLRQDENDHWWIDVAYDGEPRDPGSVEATLVIETDHPEMPVVRVDCFATIPRHP